MARLALFPAAALLVLMAGCTRSTDAPPDSTGGTDAGNRLAPTPAQVAAFQADGPEAAIRRLAEADYVLHYAVMRASGMEEALGGTAPALAALQALGDQYEHQARALQGEVPKMIPASLTGEGMDSGFVGLGMGGFAGFMGGGLVGGMVSEMPDDRLAELVAQGPVKLGEGSKNRLDLTFSEDGSMQQDLEFDGNVVEGLSGKITMKMKMDACPDTEGKVAVHMTIDSTMAVDGKPGVGGSVHSEYRYERYLDDDAQLMPQDGTAAHMYVKASGHGGGKDQAFEGTMGYGRGGANPVYDFDEHGYSIFRMDEARATVKLIDQTFIYQQLLSEMMLRGVGRGSPWESGRCVVLKPTSSPARRKGARPDTAYDIEAAPRAKSDGAPTGGTVKATLEGGNQLQPSGGKVPADAQYAYSNPDKEDESATITFEARSKRGVGRATLAFDTRRPRAYAAEGGLDDFHGTGTICDLGQPFTISGGGNTVTFTPSSEDAGSYTYAGNMGGIGVHGSGTYRVKADDSGGTLTGTGNGCVVTPMGTRCAGGTERYTLTPIAPCAQE